MTYTDNNFDNFALDILGLAIFMKSWCMDCEKTDRLQESVFRCSSCEFSAEDSRCVIKQFVRKYLEYKSEVSCCTSSRV